MDNKDDKKTPVMGAANPVIVKELFEHLIKSFEEFIRTHDGMQYQDGVMGVHNFVKSIVWDLEDRTGNTGLIVEIFKANFEQYIFNDKTHGKKAS